MEDSKWKPQLIKAKNKNKKSLYPEPLSETYSEPSETSKMELSAKMVDCIQRFTIYAKHLILRVSQGYEYASNKTNQNPAALSLFS